MKMSLFEYLDDLYDACIQIIYKNIFLFLNVHDIIVWFKIIYVFLFFIF